MLRSPYLFTLILLPLWTLAADAPSRPERSSRGSSAVQGAPPPVIVVPERPIVGIDSARTRGSPTAALAIVEFADYQCPYCRSFHVGTLPKLEAAYVKTGKVRYIYKDFPLPNHAQAFGAAVAAYCAGAQGRYWEMQDSLYAEQARLGRALYTELAAALKLNGERFHACLGSDTARRAVTRDLNEGRRLGVRATPTFFLGRIEQDRVVIERSATGAPEFEGFAREIEALAR